MGVSFRAHGGLSRDTQRRGSPTSKGNRRAVSSARLPAGRRSFLIEVGDGVAVVALRDEPLCLVGGDDPDVAWLVVLPLGLGVVAVDEPGLLTALAQPARKGERIAQVTDSVEHY